MARKDVTNGLVSQDMTDANDNFIELYAEIEAARDGEASLLAKERAQDLAISSLMVGTGVPASVNDTVPGTLSTKLTSDDGSIDLEITSPGGNEKIDLSVRGGATTTSGADDITLTAASTVSHKITLTAADKFVILPDATTMRQGDSFYFVNDGNYRFGVKGNGGAFVCSIEAKGCGRIILIDNSTAAGTWKAADGADLIMNRIKTACNSDIYCSDVTSCKMTSTEVFVAWQGTNEDGFCAVLTYTGTDITVSNILEFDEANYLHGSCDRISDTIVAISYAGTDNDGYIAAIEYDGVDTLSVLDTHEFKDAGTISYTSCNVITSALVFVSYQDSGVLGQVLNWTGTEFTANTAETALLVAGVHPRSTLISGAAGAATFLLTMYVSSKDTNAYIVTWNGAALSVGTSNVINTSSYSANRTSNIMLGTGYCVIFGGFVGINASVPVKMIASLCSISGAAVTVIKKLDLGPYSLSLSFRPESATPIDSDTILVAANATNGNGYKDFRIWKIKAVGAATEKDCVLKVDSELKNMAGQLHYSMVALDASGGLRVFQGVDGTTYLHAERIEVG